MFKTPLYSLKMALSSCAAKVFKSFRRTESYLFSYSSRFYTIQPPDWMGGKSKLVIGGRFDFPEHARTYEERIAELNSNKSADVKCGKNIGIETARPVRDRSKANAIANANRQRPELERASRLRQLKIPLDEVQREWWHESAPTHLHTIAEHYGIFRDLFDGNFFQPVVKLNIGFDYDSDYVTPVYYGNKITPSEAQNQPAVDFSSESGSLWTLLLTNPDGNLLDNSSECVHWLIGNIPGRDVARGEVLVDYLQPFPVKGTGFHRYVFILFEQKQRIDFSSWQRTIPCHTLANRSHSTFNFFSANQNNLVPKGLAFFQSDWDETVRKVFHQVFDMGEPVYEYVHPQPYHPPPRKYPHKEPFDRYFDRYRHKKDIAEEVLCKKLSMVSPFEKRPEPEQYPLIYRDKQYKPSWLKLREAIMHRRQEQYKDLP